jgi:hypothetical protein
MVQRSKLGMSALGVLGLVAMTAPAAHATTGGGNTGGSQPPPGNVVVVQHLDNPRQLNWDASGETLIIAEAGRGGDECVSTPDAPPGEPTVGCVGSTGAISTVAQPWGVTGSEPNRVVEGFLSFAGPDGSFATGSNGADALEAAHPNEFIVAGSDPDAFAAEGPEAAGALLFGAEGEDDESSFVISLVDLYEAESQLNPDGAQIESNPYAVLFIDPTPELADNDGYALVADAAANTVWRITPDYSYVGPPQCQLDEPPADFDFRDCLKFDVSVFSVYPTTPEDSPDQPPEFVPTSLATDEWGNVFVGGLGSLSPGDGAIVKYTPDGKEITRWTGLTAVTGVAVTGNYVYASQLFGTPLPPNLFDPSPEGTPGSVVRLDRWNPNGAHVELDVPFPAGLAADRNGNVYASVNSVAPAEGVAASPLNPPLDGGAVWKLDFSGARPFAPLIPLGAFPPPDSGGQFLPLSPFAVDVNAVETCGTQVIAGPGSVWAAEYRSTHNADGSVLVEFRGPVTFDVLRVSDGKALDEVDVSGPGFLLVSADRLTLTESSDGPAIIGAFSPPEVAVFAAAGLPPGFIFQGGNFTETLHFGDGPFGPGTELVSATIDNNTMTGVQDVCGLLDASPLTVPVPEILLPGAPPA